MDRSFLSRLELDSETTERIMKGLAKDSRPQVVQRMYLENVDPAKNHHKFYEVITEYHGACDRYRLWVRYGRIGNYGQEHTKFEGESIDKLADELEKLLVKKLFKRGYVMHDSEVHPENARDGDRDRFAESFD